MSEKIAQLNEEIIRGANQETGPQHRGGNAERVVGERVPRCRRPATNAARLAKATTVATMAGISLRHMATLQYICRVSKARSLRRATLSGIVAERAARRKPSSRCIRQEPMCAVWRTSLKPREAARSRPPSSVN